MQFKVWLESTFVDGIGVKRKYKPCPKCNGDMTHKCPQPNENYTYKGSIRCKDCGHITCAEGWSDKVE